MKITKFEQSGFIIESEKGFRLAIDIGNKTPLEKLDGISCDTMLISHIHGDHFSIEQIKKLNPKTILLPRNCYDVLHEQSIIDVVTASPADKPVIASNMCIISTEAEYEDENFTLQVFSVDHGPNLTVPITENYGFLINVDDQNIYFAGDMFYESEIDVSELVVDYLLLPVGTFYTFGPEEAFDFAQKFEKIGKIISMHYENKPETHGQFLELVKGTFDVE
ncbi:MAG: MBL fold metallo-hydrolase [bacterium]